MRQLWSKAGHPGRREMRKPLRDEQREGNQKDVFVSLSLSPGCFPLVQGLNAEQLLPRKPHGLKIQAGEPGKNERQREMELLAWSHITRQWQTCGQRAALETELQRSPHFILTCLCSYSFWRLIGHVCNTAKQTKAAQVSELL